MIEVLIVGAGPTGLTLACDLLRRGVSVQLIERRADGPFLASKGKGLQPRTLELFDNLGIVQSVIAAGRPYPPLAFYEGGKVIREHHLMTVREASETVPFPNAVMIPQWKTEELLGKLLVDLGGRIDYQHDFVSLEQDDRSVVATVSGPSGQETIEAKYLVAADGGRSAVRTFLGLQLVGETPEYEGLLVADVYVDGLSRDYWHFWGKTLKDAAMLCPLPSTAAFQFTASLASGENPELSIETLQSYLDKRAGGNSPKILRQSWMSIFRPNIRMVERFRAGRVFLAGDAAHVHTPAGAQGLNTSVQDANNLGWKLGAALQSGDDSLLDTYQEERLPVAAALLGGSDLLYRLSLEGNVASLRRADDEHQLLLNYRGASAFGPINPDTILQPGDRLPNAWLQKEDGQNLNLFDLLRGPDWAVLSIDSAGQAPDDEFNATLGKITGFQIRTQGEAQEGEYAATGSALKELSGKRVYVRPDRYIAAIHS